MFVIDVTSELQTNTSVASSLGTYFLPQITLIFLDMLNVYRYILFTSKSLHCFGVGLGLGSK